MSEDQQEDLQVMLDKVSDLYSSTQYMTTLRLAQEAHRKARNEKELIHLLNANFYIMNSANSSMNYKRAVEACLETIPLLESEEEASKLQPDFEPSQYYQYQWWLSACTYDNLATATAALQGNNADGLHQCIADGIAVCQRTGKTQCITCFREYATEVFLASDDLQMARKHAEINANRKSGESKERVWVSTRDLIGMAMLEGDYEQAQRLFEKAPGEIGDYYNSEKAKSDCYTKQEELKLMLGELRSSEELEGNREKTPELRSAEENPRGKMELDKNDALLCVLSDQSEKALEILGRWDRNLLELGHLKDWFDVRLRILAIVFKSSPESKRFEKLSSQLLEKARNANDWLTVRRFQYLRSGEVNWTPLALLGTPSQGIFRNAENESEPDSSVGSFESEPLTQGEGPALANSDLGEDSSLAQALNDIQVRFIELISQESEEQSEFDSLWQELTGLQFSEGPAPQVARLLYLADGIGWHSDSPWKAFDWLKDVLKQFPGDARIHSFVASLAETMIANREQKLDEGKESLSELPLGLDNSWVAELHAFAVKSASESPSVFSRAGGFYFRQSDFDKAERYLARASRLDRTDAFAAMKLAEIYNNTDRQLDALNVLDLCIRNGSADSEVVWSALMTAKTLEKYEELLAYADRFDELVEDYPWSFYYASDALLHLDRPSEALVKIERLMQSPESDKLASLSMQALALSKLRREEESEQVIEELLRASLQDSEQIAPSGVAAAVSRIYDAVTLLGKEQLVDKVVKRFSVGGFLPEGYFETLVNEKEEGEEVYFFVVVVKQSLDSHWKDSLNALHFQRDWAAANQNYGVIASDAEQASKLALEFHERHWGEGCSVETVNETEHEYFDRPRIIWNSQLYATEA